MSTTFNKLPQPDAIARARLAMISEPEDVYDLLKVNPPISLYRLCKDFLNINVNLSSDGGDLANSGHIKKDEDGGITIWINPLDSDNRQRFTLAHELGHYFLHILRGDQSEFSDTPMEFRRDGQSHKEEVEANKFAARLLMPSCDIYAEVAHLVEPDEDGISPYLSEETLVRELSKTFRVSEMAMQIRLRSLGYL